MIIIIISIIIISIIDYSSSPSLLLRKWCGNATTNTRACERDSSPRISRSNLSVRSPPRALNHREREREREIAQNERHHPWAFGRAHVALNAMCPRSTPKGRSSQRRWRKGTFTTRRTWEGACEGITIARCRPWLRWTQILYLAESHLEKKWKAQKSENVGNKTGKVVVSQCQI